MPKPSIGSSGEAKPGQIFAQVDVTDTSIGFGITVPGLDSAKFRMKQPLKLTGKILSGKPLKPNLAMRAFRIASNGVAVIDETARLQTTQISDYEYAIYMRV